MPALYAIEANTQLHEGEAVFAYTLTTFMLSRPLSESASCKTLANEPSTSMRTSNSIAARPASGMQRVRNQQTFLTCAATAKSRRASADRRLGSLPRDRQGLLVLGTPLGTDEYVAAVLAAKRETQQRLLSCIPDVPDLQASWLLLHFCAAPRANYLLRNVPPALTARFAAAHDAAVATCLGSLVHRGDPMPPLYRLRSSP